MLTSKYEEFFHKFRKSEKPFGEPKDAQKKFEFVTRSKTYQLRIIPYKELYNRVREFKNKQNINDSLECAYNMKIMHLALTG